MKLLNTDIQHLKKAIVIVASLILSVQYSCKNEQENTIRSIGKVVTPKDTINFIGHWLGEGEREKIVIDIAREYEFSHQDTYVNLKFPDEVYLDRSDPLSNQKFVASIVKKEKPEWDIIMINNEYQTIADMNKNPNWANEALVDFSEMPEFKNNTMKSLISDSIKRIWGGIIPGPFIEGVNWSVWCNNEVAKKIGVTVKQTNMTYDDLLSYVEAVHKHNKRTGDSIVAIYEAKDWKTTFTIASQLYASELNDSREFFDKRFSNKKLKAWENTLKSIEQLAKYQPLPALSETKPWDVGEKILADKCLFFVNGSWMYNIWTKSNRENIKKIMPCEYPTFRETDIYIGAYQIIWAVLKNAQHKEQAVDFLLKLNSTKVAEKWTNSTKCPTGINLNFSSSSFGDDNFSLFTNHIDKKYGAKKYSPNESSEHYFGFKNKEVKNYYNEVMRGEITAQKAMQNIRAQLKL